MTMFDERERAFEKKFSMDQEFNFRAQARRNKLLGEWAAAKLGLPGPAVSEYVKEVVNADLAGADDGAYQKVRSDLALHGVEVSGHELRQTMADFLRMAIRQIEGAAT
jgi:hypothetical protein